MLANCIISHWCSEINTPKDLILKFPMSNFTMGNFSFVQICFTTCVSSPRSYLNKQGYPVKTSIDFLISQIVVITRFVTRCSYYVFDKEYINKQKTIIKECIFSPKVILENILQFISIHIWKHLKRNQLDIHSTAY